MTYICLYSPSWTSQQLALPSLCVELIQLAPRVVVEPGKRLIWADGRSLDVRVLADSLVEAISGIGPGTPAAGIAITPVAAEVAARIPDRSGRTSIVVAPGQDRVFLHALPIGVLDPSPALFALLEGVGVESCGDLSELEQEPVEIRFGIEGVHLWRLARADDRRRIFAPMPRSLPQASYEWVDYTLTDPERLVFVINALVGRITDSLHGNGQCAREMTLLFSLANRQTFEHLVRPARSTASQRAWMRLIRTHLDRIELPDGVTGITVRVDSVTGEMERQGDIFDRGFATARVTEETVAQLLDDQGAVVVVPSNSSHPLIERRTSWIRQEPSAISTRARSRAKPAAQQSPQLTLQLFAEPKRVSVRTEKRRDHVLPLGYQEGSRWVKIDSAAGPDRVSGGRWQTDAYAREYFRCVTGEGQLVWLFRDARDNSWYLQGWWD